ncbi:MAG: alpha/beta hydrolase [Anaerolineales bacterium]|nr:alpha/beta hydrolase [Anaerolineales bacterium]
MAKAEFGDDGFVEIDSRWIHYVEAGTGFPLILIPGSYSTYRVWNSVLAILAERFRLFALDPLGAGDSDKPAAGFRYTIGEQADAIAKGIRSLRLGKAHVVGASYGGTIAFNLAARYPDRIGKIVSIEGGIVRPKSLPGSPLEKILKYPVLGDALIGAIRAGWLNEIALDTIAEGWPMTKAERGRMRKEISFNARSAKRAAWYWIGRSHETLTPFEEEAKRIAAPVLYLRGGRSEFWEMAAETVRFLEQYLPQARIQTVEDGIHDLPSQKPYAVAEAILNFL